MKALATTLLAAGALGLPLALPASAAWRQPVGGASPINASATEDAAEPSIGVFSGMPYVAWAEPDGSGVNQIRAARLDAAGTAWEQVGESSSPINVSPTSDAENPTLRRDDPHDTPCIAFDEEAGSATRIHMSCLSASTDWVTVGDSPNRDTGAIASNPSLTLFEGVSWVAWTEIDGGGVNQIRAARLPPPGSSWARVPDTASPINADSGDDAFDPSLAAIGSSLYLAWSEVDAGVSQIHVAVLDETTETWNHAGGTLNKDPSMNAAEPSLANVGGVPYVAWSETGGLGVTEIRVARLNGTTWALVADSASPINEAFTQDAGHPSLVEIAGVPYVAWSESDGTADQVRVARLSATGTSWEKVAGSASPINDSSLLDATEPSLTNIGGFPYVGWGEIDEDGVNQIRAARLEPDFLSQGAGDLSVSGATLNAQVRAYGLPFPIGFDHGQTLEHETTPQPAATGQGDLVSVSQPVSGLAPRMSYQVRPFATAGIALPRVMGGTGSFTTPAIQRLLTVVGSGSGAGSVDSVPAGVDCSVNQAGPAICSHSFDDGTVVTLKAHPGRGSEFLGFSGGGCASLEITCHLTMSEARTVRVSFAPATPNPHPMPPGPGPGPGPPNPSPAAPNTTIVKHPKRKSRSRTAVFRFRASVSGAKFRCKLDRRRYRTCRSPLRFRRLKHGRHVLRVLATSPSGSAERSPATFRWRVALPRRHRR